MLNSTVGNWSFKEAVAKDELHVGLPIPNAVARNIHQWAQKQPFPEGTELEHPKNHHITLLYSPEGGREHRDSGWINHLDKAQAETTGFDVFPSEEGQYAYVLRVNSPDISDHANKLQGRAKWMGLPVSEFEGGFKPHITVGYGPTPNVTGIQAPEFDFDVGPSETSPQRPTKESAEQPQMMYHVSPGKNHESIMTNGLDATGHPGGYVWTGDKSGQYLFDSLGVAERAAKRDFTPGSNIYAVNVEGLLPQIDRNFPNSYVVQDSIEPERITHHGTVIQPIAGGPRIQRMCSKCGGALDFHGNCPTCNPTDEWRQASAQVMYHVAPISNRSSIEQFGLDPSRGERMKGFKHQPGVYLWPDLQTAQQWASPTTHEVWEAQVEPQTQAMAHNQGFGLTNDLIPPERIRRIAAAPVKPLNYRKGSAKEHCGNCQMFWQGKCWGYGNTPVKESAVCDSWAAETKTKMGSPLVEPLEPRITVYHGTTNRALERARQRGVLEPWHPHDVASEVATHYGLDPKELYDHPYFEFSRNRSRDPNLYVTTRPETAQHYAEARSEQLEDALNTAHRMLNPKMYNDAAVEGLAGTPDQYYKTILNQSKESFRNQYHQQNDIHPQIIAINLPHSAVPDDQQTALQYEVTHGLHPTTFGGTYMVPGPIPLDWISPQRVSAAWNPLQCEQCGHPMTEPQKVGPHWMNHCTFCGLWREVPTDFKPLVEQQEQEAFSPYPDLLQQVQPANRPWVYSAEKFASELHQHFTKTQDVDIVEYTRQLLRTAGYPDDDITTQAMLQAWQQLHPHDKVAASPYTHHNLWTGLPCNCPWNHRAQLLRRTAGQNLNKVLKAPDKIYRTPEGAKFRQILPQIVGEEHDALAPYIAQRWKKREIQLAENDVPAVQTSTNYPYPEHVQEFSRNAGWGQLSDELPQWSQWYNARQHPSRRGVNIMDPNFTVHDMRAKTWEHQRALAAEKEAEQQRGLGRTVHHFPPDPGGVIDWDEARAQVHNSPDYNHQQNANIQLLQQNEMEGRHPFYDPDYDFGEPHPRTKERQAELAALSNDIRDEYGSQPRGKGWHIKHLNSNVNDNGEPYDVDAAMEGEGHAMGHCLGSDDQPYKRCANQGKIDVYSLRDPRGNPHVTWHYNSDGSLAEMFGPNDDPIKPEYQHMLNEWGKNGGMETDPDYAQGHMEEPGLAEWRAENPETMEEYLAQNGDYEDLWNQATNSGDAIDDETQLYPGEPQWPEIAKNMLGYDAPRPFSYDSGNFHPSQLASNQDISEMHHAVANMGELQPLHQALNEHPIEHPLQQEVLNEWNRRTQPFWNPNTGILEKDDNAWRNHQPALWGPETTQAQREFALDPTSVRQDPETFWFSGVQGKEREVTEPSEVENPEDNWDHFQSDDSKQHHNVVIDPDEAWNRTGNDRLSMPYHVAPTQRRKLIEEQGLRTDAPRINQKSQHPEGVYMWDDPDVAWKYRGQGPNMYADMDVWHVNTEGLDLKRDPWFDEHHQDRATDFPGGTYYPDVIEPERLAPHAMNPWFADDHPHPAWNRTGAAEDLTWTPGSSGKGMVAPDGRIFSWNVDRNDEPSHLAYMLDQGYPIDPDLPTYQGHRPVNIEPDGETSGEGAEHLTSVDPRTYLTGTRRPQSTGFGHGQSILDRLGWNRTGAITPVASQQR